MRRAFIGKILLLVFALAVPAALAKEAKSSGKATRRDRVYVCACGETCTCVTAAVKPGKCACGKDLQGGHVVKVEKDEALVCVCGADCACKLDPKDTTKCSCGKALRRVALKGTGLYFCNCGGSCACNTLSAKAGKCGCGMALHKAE